MKLRLVLNTKTKNGKPYILKLNIPPSKQKGFSNLIKMAQEQDTEIALNFEMLSDDGTVKQSNVEGKFQLKKKQERTNVEEKK
jgi:hypothetical protein